MNMNKKHLAGEKRIAAIDWKEIYRRIETAGRALEQGWEPSPEEKKRILKARAKELAGEQAEEDSGGSVDVIEFRLAQERYSVESAYVREVFSLKDITPIPGLPPFVAGIVNVRGRILSIIDIKKFFDLPEKGLGDLNKVIILDSGHAMTSVGGMEFGILADAILGTRSIAVSELQAAPVTFTGVREEYLKGITADRMAVLDGEKLLSDERLIVREEI